MTFNEILAKVAAAQDPEERILATLDIFLADRDPQLREALEAAAVPHWFDAGILAALLDLSANTAQDAMEALRRLPMIETFAARGGYCVNGVSRVAIRRRLASAAPTDLRTLSDRAAKCFKGEEVISQVERVYHRLVAAPDSAHEELRHLWLAWDQGGHRDGIESLALALQELVDAKHLQPGPHARALLCLASVRGPRYALRQREDYASRAWHILEPMTDAQSLADAHTLLNGLREELGKPPLSDGSSTRTARPHDVFVSHASDDTDTAQMLCSQLETRSIRCWMATRDVGLGTKYAAEILFAIKASGALLLIGSCRAYESPHVQRELHIAVNERKPIVWVKIDDTLPPAEVEYCVSGTHWKRIGTQPSDSDLDEIARAARRLTRADRGTSHDNQLPGVPSQPRLK